MQASYGRAASATAQERLESARSEFDGVRAEMVREAKRAAKLEERARTLLRGLTERNEKLQARSVEAWQQALDAQARPGPCEHGLLYLQLL